MGLRAATRTQEGQTEHSGALLFMDISCLGCYPGQKKVSSFPWTWAASPLVALSPIVSTKL
jgi:hypothetical protein